MSCRIWLAAALTAILAVPATAQTSDSSKTTQSGVFDSTQASRGKDIYAGYCRNCHTAESHTGATFVATWKERSLVDLFGFIQERMPKNEPGSLSDREYVDVMAYLLKMNGMPAGKSELPVDSTALSKIRIHFLKANVAPER